MIVATIAKFSFSPGEREMRFTMDYFHLAALTIAIGIFRSFAHHRQISVLPELGLFRKPCREEFVQS